MVNSKTAVDWTALGFQGTDPLTDFRGGGLLSLQQLAFFAENYTAQVRAINSRANHPTKVTNFSFKIHNPFEPNLRFIPEDFNKKCLYKTYSNHNIPRSLIRFMIFGCFS